MAVPGPRRRWTLQAPRYRSRPLCGRPDLHVAHIVSASEKSRFAHAFLIQPNTLQTSEVTHILNHILETTIHSMHSNMSVYEHMSSKRNMETLKAQLAAVVTHGCSVLSFGYRVNRIFKACVCCSHYCMLMINK